ncbi:MAG TPA: lysophospholipid acyltransferase family protein [Acidobacteriota bacterium]|nr:lysophospholipid acyltransferase family protein [Acidobacteriota bacterium]
MKKRPSTAPEFTTSQRLQILAISRLGSLAVHLIGSTIRFEAREIERLTRIKEAGRPVIYSFWHNQIFAATYYFRFQGIVVITSQHFDGEYIARIIESFGYGTARGSSSRGAVRALLELKRHLSLGRDVAFTVDGPRGPLYQVKPGPIWLAQRTGAPIVPFHIEPFYFWSLPSWDRFRIPRPFTPAVIRFGGPIEVPPEGSDEEQLALYQAEMNRIQKEAIEEVKARRKS